MKLCHGRFRDTSEIATHLVITLHKIKEVRQRVVMTDNILLEILVSVGMLIFGAINGTFIKLFNALERICFN